MSIDEALAAVAALIQSATGSDVRVARPSETVTGLVVWPWRVMDVSSQKNLPGQRTIGPVTRTPYILEVSFFLLASPSGAEGNGSQLMQAHKTLLGNPVISANGSDLRVVAQQLPVEQLAAVFTAAQLQLSLCTNYALQFTL